MKNIYLYSSIYETVPHCCAHSHAEVAKFCAQQRNQLKLAEYRRTGDKRMKKALVYTILSEFKPGAPQQRASQNLQWTTHLQFDLDYLQGKTPDEMATHIVSCLSEVDPQLKDHIYIEHSPTEGRLHCILLRIGDGTIRQELQRYARFFDIEGADLCVTDPARFMSVTLESLQGTTLDNVLRPLPADLLTKLQTALGPISAPAAARPIVEAKCAVANPYTAELMNLVRDHLINALGGIPQEGERNHFVFKFACEMYSLFGDDHDAILSLLDHYSYFGLSRDECERTIKNALRSKAQDGTYERSQLLRDAIADAMKAKGVSPVILSQQAEAVLRPQSSLELPVEEVAVEPVVEEEPATVDEPAVEESAVDVAIVAEAEASEDEAVPFDPFSDTPPQIEFSQLPAFLKVLLRGMPMKVAPHCINMLEPCAATYLMDAYTTDIVGQKLWLGSGWLNFTVAPMSSGKGSKNIPMAALKKKLLEMDLSSRAEQQEWLKIAKSCKSSDLPPRPPHKTHLLASDTTSSALLQKLSQCPEGALFCEVDELSMLRNLSSNTDPTIPLLLAFCRERISVDRSSSEGEVGSVEMALNVAATGTNHTASQFFKNCWHNGLISRCSFSTIVSGSDETFDDDFEYRSNIDEEKLAMYIQRLENSANQELSCPKANEFAKRMRRELQLIGAQYDNEPLKILARRQAIILQKQCYLYWILEGRKWSKKLEAFLEWRFRYAIWALWHCVGHIIEAEHKQELDATAKQKQNGPCNWLEFLPQTFKKEDLISLRTLRGSNTDSKSITKQISNWRSRGFIKDDPETPGKYINLKFKKKS